ncbi:MAG: ATP-binding protein [Bacteroidales bacterium]|nr:ATP-binding protein [Candidatus Cacconaster caballi]
MEAQTTLRNLPIGIQNFESLRADGYLYVDKTQLIYKLVTTGRYYFLSRPRRFGKSLLISTIHSYFSGRKDLFEGLEIEKLEKEWIEHPVLHLDLNTNKYDTPEVLEQKLGESLNQWEEQYGCSRPDLTFGMRFENVIRRAYEKTGRKVVILVDEYDKPMLQAIGNPELQDAYRATLKGFYGALKSMDGCIKFALLTGVTKFGKVSVFSDLNNLNDISMDADYYDICGITEEELRTQFVPEISQLAERNGITEDKCLERLREKYDGYHFEDSVPGVYNPFSLLNAFYKKKFGSYWFETGTPTYLVQLLQERDYDLEEMSRVKADADELNSIDSTSNNPIPVVYQSGYLTIKGFDPEFGTYTLGFPNAEVEEGFTKYLMPNYIHREENRSPFLINNFVEDVRSGNTEQFIKRLRSLFADTPYEIIRNMETHYRNVIWLLFKLMGFYTQAEYRTSEGRIDMVVKTPKFCYVLEFKLNGTAEEALAQIQDKNYTLPFEIEGQQIIRLGINFDSATRNIDKVLVG